jgi:hypothetical protein
MNNLEHEVTEQEWLKSNLLSMLKFATTFNSPSRKINHPGVRLFSLRKRILLAVAYCRDVENLINPKIKLIIDWLERYADGDKSITRRKLKAIFADLSLTVPDRIVAFALSVASYASISNIFNVGAQSSCIHWVTRTKTTIEFYFSEDRNYQITQHQTAILRNLFNPFLPTVQTNQNILNLAKLIYKEKNFNLLPVLADAVEELNGPNQVSDHLKSPGPYFCGWWSLDMLLQ